MIGAGTVVGERYRVERALGTGAAAQVLRAVDTQLQRPVALKLLDARGPLADADRLRAEAQALATVRHPHVLAVLDHGFHEGRPFLVLELAEGGSLLDRLKAGPILPEQVVTWAEQILDALEATHAADILHRDLKPENVLLTSGGQVRLSDFGLAKHSSSGIRTASGLILGTPEFMAPEVMMGEPATPASDVYSWGCLVYTLLTRKPPHQGDLMEMLRMRQRETLDTVGLPLGFDLAVRAALRSDPRKRAGIVELRAILAGDVPAWALASSAETVAVSVEQAGVRASGVGRGAASPATAGQGAAAARAAAAAAAPPRPYLGLAVAGVGLVMVLGVVAWVLLGQGPGPTPAPPPADTGRATELAKARAAAARLADDLARDLDVAARLREAHEAAVPPVPLTLASGTEAEQIARYRNNQPLTRMDVDPTALEAHRLGLPHRKEIRLQREALEEFLGAAEVPFEEKQPLLRALQQATRVDAYFEAWGIPAPYGARELYQAGLGLETLDPETVPRPREDLRADALPQRAPYRLFERPEGQIKYPWLLARGGGTDFDMMSMGFAGILEGKAFSWAEKAQMVLEFPTPGGATPRFARASVMLGLSNLSTPSEVTLVLNERTFVYPAEVARASVATWDHAKGVEFVLSLDLPARFYRSDGNRLEIYFDTPPGVRSWGGIGLYWVGLRLAE